MQYLLSFQPCFPEGLNNLGETFNDLFCESVAEIVLARYISLDSQGRMFTLPQIHVDPRLEFGYNKTLVRIYLILFAPFS